MQISLNRVRPAPYLIRGHGLVALFGCRVFAFLSGAAFTAFSRRHIYPEFDVGRKYVVEPQNHPSYRADGVLVRERPYFQRVRIVSR